MPEQDAVVVITSGVRDMQAVLNLVWDKLLPAMASSSSPLPADEEAREEARGALKGLTLHPQEGAGSPDGVRLGQAVHLPRQRPQAGGDHARARRLRGRRGDAGRAGKRQGRADPLRPTEPGRSRRAAWGRLPEQPVGASGAWTADDTFTAKLVFYETPFINTVKLKFTGNELTCESQANVGLRIDEGTAAGGEGGVGAG